MANRVSSSVLCQLIYKYLLPPRHILIYRKREETLVSCVAAGGRTPQAPAVGRLRSRRTGQRIGGGLTPTRGGG